MAEYGLTPEGFKPKRADTIIDELGEALRGIFGESLNLAPSTPDGQVVGLFGQMLADLWELANGVNGSQDPAAAQAVALSLLVKLNGLRRKAATKSTAVVTFGGVAGTVVPQGFAVAVVNTENVFLTNAVGTIGGGGTVDIPVIAEKTGATTADPGTLSNIVNPLNGVSTATNALAADAGADEESNQLLRNRQAVSTETPSRGIIDSLYSQLLALDNVRSVFVHENDTHEFNALGLPPHSSNTVILGGDDQQIANTIYIGKAPGAVALGNTVLPVTDTQGLVRDIGFTRPTAIPIYVTINTDQLAGFPADGEDQIKAAVIAYADENFLIGGTVKRTRLYTPINSVPGHSVQELFIGLAPAPTGVVDIPLQFDEVSQFLEINIVVNI